MRRTILQPSNAYGAPVTFARPDGLSLGNEEIWEEDDMKLTVTTFLSVDGVPAERA
jgi:hypothetical protein